MAGAFQGKSTSEEDELAKLLNQEKVLTSAWYLRMSGQAPWAEGERQGFTNLFMDLSEKIREMQSRSGLGGDGGVLLRNEMSKPKVQC